MNTENIVPFARRAAPAIVQTAVLIDLSEVLDREHCDRAPPIPTIDCTELAAAIEVFEFLHETIQLGIDSGLYADAQVAINEIPNLNCSDDAQVAAFARQRGLFIARTLQNLLDRARQRALETQ